MRKLIPFLVVLGIVSYILMIKSLWFSLIGAVFLTIAIAIDMQHEPKPKESSLKEESEVEI